MTGAVPSPFAPPSPVPPPRSPPPVASRPAGTGQPYKGTAHQGAFSQSLLLAAATFLFIASVYYVFRPTSPLPYLVFPSLIAGLVYTLAGALTRMARFVWIGAGIFLVTMTGFIAAPDY